jgi:hypothetical protein
LGKIECIDGRRTVIMGWCYLTKQWECDKCGAGLGKKYSLVLEVDHPTDGETWDEYCKPCYKELGGMYWTGNWTGGSGLTKDSNIGRYPVVLDSKGNKVVVKEDML